MPTDERGYRILASKPLFGKQHVVVCEDEKEIKKARRTYAKIGVALSLREPLVSVYTDKNGNKR